MFFADPPLGACGFACSCSFVELAWCLFVGFCSAMHRLKF